MALDDDDAEFENERSAEEEMFVQEEYDLANNLEQIVSKLDSFDEYRHFRELARQYHAENAT